MSTRAPYVSADRARPRILAAARALLAERPFSALTVGAVMAEAGLARTVFYRHFDDLPSLAPELLPDADDPLVDRVGRLAPGRPQDVVAAMVDGLVAVFSEHGRLLRAIDDAAGHDPAVAERLESALVGPRQLIESLVREAPSPPPQPAESARLLMAAHRAYLLDTFGAGDAPPGARADARAALLAMWERLLA
ncbi:MAG TPA: TetR/AcrR family transcriptional regulator [Solirubrobacteraceae bacterium]|nr:TetR/AcrR family transcriptional regulator [Solirubrobacteraceae bacterium]